MSNIIREMRETMDKLQRIIESDDDADMNFGKNAKVVRAYEEGESRNLNIRGVPCNLDEWNAIMQAAVPEGYNDFEVEKVYNILATMPGMMEEDRVFFIPGREGSVVVYIWTKGDKELANQIGRFLQSEKRALRFQEIHKQKDDLIRLWWD